jgi:peptidoglycan/xylan/chitin deacetylase (PgdA/CDA1 family)
LYPINYKNTSKIVLILALLLLVSSVFNYIPWWSIIILFFIYSVILFLGSYNVCSNFYLNVFCKSGKSKNQIAITFDDGPDENNTPKILRILNDFDTRATFFVIGHKAEKCPHIIKEMIEKEHLLGNHTYNHSVVFDFYTTSKVLYELERTNILLEKISKKKIEYFRPPFGVTNPNIAKALKKNSLKVIGWSIRSLDTIKKKKTVWSRIAKVKSGDIILFHDTKTLTVEILGDFLRLCKRKKLEIVTIDELINT